MAEKGRLSPSQTSTHCSLPFALLVFAHLSASLLRLADPPPFVACGDISPTLWGNLPPDALRRFAPLAVPGDSPLPRLAFRPLRQQTLAVSATGGARVCCPRRFPPREFPLSVKDKTDTGKVSVLLWRRRGDSNSRAGYPTYALSRGASSPT